MGTPLPPNEPANNCSSCWGLGKMFGDTPTPRFISVALTRFHPGEFWHPDYDQILLMTHDLKQTTSPCVWEIRDAAFLWTLNYSFQFTTFEVARLSDHKQAFVDDFPEPCLTDIPSALVQPANHVAYGGFANFYWNQEDL